MKNLVGFLVRLAVPVGLLGSSAWAKGVPDLDILMQNLIRSPNVRQQIITQAGQSAVMTRNAPCASLDYTLQPPVVFYKPMKFTGDGTPTAGAWKQPVDAEGCGFSRHLNVLLFVHDGTKVLESKSLLPGTTKTDFTLQVDSKPYLAIAAGREDGCDTGFIEDTKFLGWVEPSGGLTEVSQGSATPWDELWTHVSCTRKEQVTLHFIPDGTGTTIRTSPQETRIIPR